MDIIDDIDNEETQDIFGRDTNNLDKDYLQDDEDYRETIIIPEDERLTLNSSLEIMNDYMRSTDVGNHIPLLTINNKVILTLGPHWYCFIFGYLAVCFVAYYTIVNFWQFSSYPTKVSVCIVVPTELILYLVTALLNPGIVKRKVPPFGKGKITCMECLTTEEDNCYHCPACGACIEGHDHHCVWTGKCIGKGNYKVFICFVVFTPCYFLTLLLVLFNAQEFVDNAGKIAAAANH